MRHLPGIAQRRIKAEKQLHAVDRSEVLGMKEKAELRLERQNQPVKSLLGHLGS